MQDKSYEAERACGLTFQFSVRHVDACETRAAREGIKRPGDLHRPQTIPAAVEHPEILAVREAIKRPCGLEKAKDRQRCQGVEVSDGLVHHYFN